MGASPPAIHIFFGTSALGEKFLSGESHVCGRHHIPVFVSWICRKTRIRKDSSFYQVGSEHGNPGHMFHSPDHDNVSKAGRNFEKPKMDAGHARPTLLS